MKFNRLAIVLVIFVFLSELSAQTSRDLSAFNKIAISGGFAQVTLEPGTSDKVTLDLNGCNPDEVITEVRGSTLVLTSSKGSSQSRKVKLTVNYRSLSSLVNTGSTDVIASSAIKGEALNVVNSGSGDFTLAMDVRNFDFVLSGSGDCKFTGQADKQHIALSGSGDINAESLKGTDAEVAVSGSGDVVLYITGDLHGKVAGSGSVVNAAKK